MSDSSRPSISCPGCAFLSQQPAERENRTSPLRIAELLRCNDPPLAPELSEFQLFRAQCPAILTDLDAKITQAHDMLQRFIRAREHAESHQHDTAVLAHPIRRIPPEILSKIFLHCLPTWMDGFSSKTEYDSMHPSHPPWTLSQVCSRWRGLSLALPEFWSRFNLVVRLHKYHITPLQCVYKTSLYMERSGNYPLSLYLSTTSRRDRLAMHPVLPVLQASSSRWRHLRFSLYKADLVAFNGHPFPMLEAIMVQRLYDTGRVDTFQSAPDLSVFLSERDLPALKLLTLPCTNLPSIARLRNITRLELLAFKVAPSQGSETVIADIFLPRLLSLHLSESPSVEPGRLASFLERLKAPTLSDLSIYFTNAVMLFPEFQPAMESLTTFTVHGDMGGCRNNTLHLLRFLSRVPTVTSLKVIDKSITSEFVVGLTVVSNKKTCLPLLRSFDISGCGYHAKMMPLKYFWAMFESRLPGARAIQTPGAVLEEIIVPHWLYDRDDERWRAIRRANIRVVRSEG